MDKKAFQLYQDKRDFLAARSLSRWSFVGVIWPYIAWMLIILSFGKLRHIEDSRLRKKARGVQTVLIASLCLSILAAGAQVAFLVWAYNDSQNTQAITQQAPATSAPVAKVNNADPLGFNRDNCFNAADKTYDDSRQHVTTIDQLNALLAEKQQAVSECNTRYPAQ